MYYNRFRFSSSHVCIITELDLVPLMHSFFGAILAMTSKDFYYFFLNCQRAKVWVRI
jgi:hypothetical protein